MVSFLNELWLFLRVRRKFWLLPIFLVMAVFGGLLVLAKGRAVPKPITKWRHLFHRDPTLRRFSPSGTSAAGG